METQGVLAPETAAAVREAYAAAGPAAREVVKETAKAMGFDRAEYADRVTSDVVETARDAAFASLLVVHHGDRAAFEEWCADRPDLTVRELGSPDVDRVVWHPAPAAGVVVAATYQNEADAAASAVRRQAFGGVYRGLLEGADGEVTDAAPPTPDEEGADDGGAADPDA
jgi:hypothetical protein